MSPLRPAMTSGELVGRMLWIAGGTVSFAVAAVMIASALGLGGSLVSQLKELWANPLTQGMSAIVVILWVGSKFSTGRAA